VKISMDGVGRAIDNVFIERLWRTLKIRPHLLEPRRERDNVSCRHQRIPQYYNEERPHSSLGDATPTRSTIHYASTSELPEPVTTCSPLKKSVRLSKGWGPLDYAVKVLRRGDRY